MSFTPFTQTKTLINNPKGRKLNKYGAPADIVSHEWVHTNARFTHGCPEVKQAFMTKEPFNALGWDVKPGCPTESVYVWWYADCPVSDDLMLSIETHKEMPHNFLEFVAKKYNVQVKYEQYNPTQSLYPIASTINP